MEYPKRKPNRLKAYDYSQNGAYFVTVCTKDRKEILSQIGVGEGLCALPYNKLTSIGKEIEKCIEYIKQNYNNVAIDKYVIMPNHIHLIILLNETGGRGNPPLPHVIGLLKSYTTNCYKNKLWQRSFHDRIIRNEKEYQKIWEYIETNPLKWEEDCFYRQES